MSDMQNIPPGTVKCAEGLGASIPATLLESEAQAYLAAAEALVDFSWRHTAEGDGFWQSIFFRLHDLASLAEAAARKPKAPEPVMIADETCDIDRIVRVSVIDGVVRWSSDGEVRDFCTAQARKAADALNKMADALDAQS